MLKKRQNSIHNNKKKKEETSENLIKKELEEVRVHGEHETFWWF